MDWLTWFLFLAVAVYATGLTVKTGGALWRYRKAKERIIKVPGEISDWFDLESVKRSGNKITTFYPVYRCAVNGNTKTLNGSVRRAGNPYEVKGRESVLLYDRETEELWCEDDLPLMVKQIKVRLLTVAIVLLLMVVTSVML